MRPIAVAPLRVPSPEKESWHRAGLPPTRA
jgi:hypothetical protein